MPISPVYKGSAHCGCRCWCFMSAARVPQEKWCPLWWDLTWISNLRLLSMVPCCPCYSGRIQASIYIKLSCNFVRLDSLVNQTNRDSSQWLQSNGVITSFNHSPFGNVYECVFHMPLRVPWTTCGWCGSCSKLSVLASLCCIRSDMVIPNGWCAKRGSTGETYYWPSDVSTGTTWVYPTVEDPVQLQNTWAKLTYITLRRSCLSAEE